MRGIDCQGGWDEWKHPVPIFVNNRLGNFGHLLGASWQHRRVSVCLGRVAWSNPLLPLHMRYSFQPFFSTGLIDTRALTWSENTSQDVEMLDAPENRAPPADAVHLNKPNTDLGT